MFGITYYELAKPTLHLITPHELKIIKDADHSFKALIFGAAGTSISMIGSVACSIFGYDSTPLWRATQLAFCFEGCLIFLNYRLEQKALDVIGVLQDRDIISHRRS